MYERFTEPADFISTTSAYAYARHNLANLIIAAIEEQEKNPPDAQSGA